MNVDLAKVELQLAEVRANLAALLTAQSKGPFFYKKERKSVILLSSSERKRTNLFIH